jgi:PadR family transcriptional regulator PadR
MSRHIVADQIKPDLLQGTLDMLVLQVVALEALHGYAIGQRLRQITRDKLNVQQGSLYPALHRLEERGWLRAEWKPSETGRDAKFYSLTKAGRRQLQIERLNWRRLAQAIALVLREGAANP